MLKHLPRKFSISLKLRLNLAVLAVGFLCSVFMISVSAEQPETKTGGKKTADPKKTGTKVAPVVFSDIIVSPGAVDQVAFINEQITKKWAENKLRPSDRCTDYEFIRRASLDLVGRIAKPAEIEQFMRDPPRERRSRLIERLLASEEFANHFANVWTNLLLTRGGGKIYHEQMHLWLFEQFAKTNADWSKITKDLLSATGRTNDNGAVNFILAHLGEEIRDDRGANGRYEMVPVTSRTTKLFLGLRTQCTQCHDHPFNDEWQQKHFWGVNAFFRQVDTPTGRPTMVANKKKGKGLGGQFELVDNTSYNRDGIVGYERRSGVLMFTKAVFLTGDKMPADTKNRREALANFVTTNDYFSKAFVNRMWGHFFGRGFTKDVDDFGEHNTISHPELLNKLAKDWATKYNHDPRALIRWICNSQAYQLSSIANETNDKADDEPYFARMLLKAMSPEQLFESLMIATDAKAGQNRDSRKERREDWLNKLIVNFGDDEGNEGTFSGTVVQALLLMNGKDINEAIMDEKEGTVAAVMRRYKVTSLAGMRAPMRDLYLAALNRPPSEAEYQRILTPRMMNLPKLNNQWNQDFYKACCQDIMWALLNSNEFMLNH